MVKVRTQSRLYRGAKLEFKEGAQSVIRRVTREGASFWRDGEGFTTEVDIEPAVLCVGDYTIDATSDTAPNWEGCSKSGCWKTATSSGYCDRHANADAKR